MHVVTIKIYKIVPTGRNLPINVQAYELRRYLASGTSLFSVQQYSADIFEVHLPCYRFSIVIMSWGNFMYVQWLV